MEGAPYRDILMKYFLLLLATFGLSGQAFSTVYVKCNEEIQLVRADGSQEVFTVYETKGAGDTLEKAVSTAGFRSIYTCRQMYSEHNFGDGWDCPSQGRTIACGFSRYPGAPARDSSLPNPPQKAYCYFKAETCYETPSL